jgi:polar amino acid transport system ATP-binding protein
MVFQHFNLFPHMNIMENLIYAPIHAFAISRAEATGQARSLLSRVGLEARASNFPSQLSGGEKQRAAIARTLMINPEVILFDEPTSALDPEMVQEVLEVIKGLSHTSITIMLVTHEMSFARSVADRILFFDAGRLVEEGIPAEFFANPKTIRAQEFLNKVLR